MHAANPHSGSICLGRPLLCWLTLVRDNCWAGPRIKQVLLLHHRQLILPHEGSSMGVAAPVTLPAHLLAGAQPTHGHVRRHGALCVVPSNRRHRPWCCSCSCSNCSSSLMACMQGMALLLVLLLLLELELCRQHAGALVLLLLVLLLLQGKVRAQGQPNLVVALPAPDTPSAGRARVAATAPTCCSCVGIPQHEPHSLLLLVMVCKVCLQRIPWVRARHASSSGSSSTCSRRCPHPAADRRHWRHMRCGELLRRQCSPSCCCCPRHSRLRGDSCRPTHASVRTALPRRCVLLLLLPAAGTCIGWVDSVDWLSAGSPAGGEVGCVAVCQAAPYTA